MDIGQSTNTTPNINNTDTISRSNASSIARRISQATAKKISRKTDQVLSGTRKLRDLKGQERGYVIRKLRTLGDRERGYIITPKPQKNIMNLKKKKPLTLIDPLKKEFINSLMNRMLDSSGTRKLRTLGDRERGYVITPKPQKNIMNLKRKKPLTLTDLLKKEFMNSFLKRILMFPNTPKEIRNLMSDWLSALYDQDHQKFKDTFRKLSVISTSRHSFLYWLISTNNCPSAMLKMILDAAEDLDLLKNTFPIDRRGIFKTIIAHNNFDLFKVMFEHQKTLDAFILHPLKDYNLGIKHYQSHILYLISMSSDLNASDKTKYFSIITEAMNHFTDESKSISLEAIKKLAQLISVKKHHWFILLCFELPSVAKQWLTLRASRQDNDHDLSFDNQFIDNLHDHLKNYKFTEHGTRPEELTDILKLITNTDNL